MIIAKVVFLFRTKCYILVDQKLNFHNAERFCKSEFGGSLASIRNISEFNFIETMLDSYYPEDQAFYIGENRSWNLGNKCQDITHFHYLSNPNSCRWKIILGYLWMEWSIQSCSDEEFRLEVWLCFINYNFAIYLPNWQRSTSFKVERTISKSRCGDFNSNWIPAIFNTLIHFY